MKRLKLKSKWKTSWNEASKFQEKVNQIFKINNDLPWLGDGEGELHEDLYDDSNKIKENRFKIRLKKLSFKKLWLKKL